MKKNWSSKVGFLVVASILLVFASCKGAPEAKATEQPTQKQAVGLEKEALDARNAAVAVHADTLFAKEFAIADAELQVAKTAQAKGQKDEADKAFTNARDKYITLMNLANAAADKEKIEENNFAQYAPEDYKKFIEAYNKSLATYGSDTQASLEAAKKAAMYAQKVKNAGYMHLAKDAKARADAAKKKCDSIQGQRSAKTEYQHAVSLYSKAKLAVEKNDYEQVYLNYVQAAKEFDGIFTSVSEKRAKALEAMRLAKEEQEKSARLAREADKEAPIESDPNGDFSNEAIDVSNE